MPGGAPIFEEIDWDQAKALLRTGEIAVIFSHTDGLAITMEDGTRYITQGGETVDTLFAELESCGDACPPVLVNPE